MEYSNFINILNTQIFENSKIDLIEKISKYPSRYIGLFRPTKPEAKLLQNLLQSNEIKFGDALEVLFRGYFQNIGFTNLDRDIDTPEAREYLSLDQLFTDGKYIYFIEQKIRDDHDSTKKRGQIDNFEKKIIALLKLYDESSIKSTMYFIDPALVKNKTYYNRELSKISSDYNISTKLCYGEEFWSEVGHKEIWHEILDYLKQWKSEIPDMPSVNFDKDAENTFNEIKNLSPMVYRNIFKNEQVCKEILPILFPNNEVLKMLQSYFYDLGNSQTIYKNLAEMIKNYIE